MVDKKNPDITSIPSYSQLKFRKIRQMSLSSSFQYISHLKCPAPLSFYSTMRFSTLTSINRVRCLNMLPAWILHAFVSVNVRIRCGSVVSSLDMLVYGSETNKGTADVLHSDVHSQNLSWEQVESFGTGHWSWVLLMVSIIFSLSK